MYAVSVCFVRDILSGILLMTVTLILALNHSVLVAIIAALLMLIVNRTVIKLLAIGRLMDWIYRRYEKSILRAMKSIKGVLGVLGVNRRGSLVRTAVESRDELLNIIEKLPPHVASEDEKRILRAGVKFDGKTVRDIMIDASDIKSIDVRETLGPLVQDDLYKTGHSYFPVVDGHIDRIVGVLCTRELLSVDGHKTPHVRDEMRRDVLRVEDDLGLEQLLESLIETDNRLAIVTGKGKTLGLVSLGDVVSKLIGRDVVVR